MCPEFTLLNVYFLSLRILNNLRLPWKTESTLELFTVLKYFLSVRIFEQLVACPEKQSVPWIHRIECIFYPWEFWKTCACPEKQNLPLTFFLYWIIFYLSWFLRNLSLPWKQSLPWIFQAGGAAAPATVHKRKKESNVCRTFSTAQFLSETTTVCCEAVSRKIFHHAESLQDRLSYTSISAEAITPQSNITSSAFSGFLEVCISFYSLC